MRPMLALPILWLVTNNPVQAQDRPLDLAKVPRQPGVFETASGVGISTVSTILVLDHKTGRLIHLVDRASGQEFIAGAVPRPLFSFTLTKPYAVKRIEIQAADFRNVSVRKVGPTKLELTFAEHVSLPLRVGVSVSADAEGMLRLRFALGNKSDWAVSRIEFPHFASPAALGSSGADDRMILPAPPVMDTGLMEAPGSRTQAWTALYPEMASVQFEALYDATAGLYMATYDPDGHHKQWRLRTEKDRFVEMPLAHLVPEIAGKDVELPYDVVLGTFAGDWRDAADIYKRWAKQQPWCARKASQSDVIPTSLKEGAAVLCIPFRHEKLEYSLYSFREMDRFPQIAATFRERTQLPHIGFVPFGWENRGAWAGINYFPAVPSDEAWQRVSAQLRKQGDFIFMLPSGFSWVTRRRETRSGPAFDDTADFERRKEMAVYDATGKPWVQDRLADTVSWRGVTAKLCHGSAAARETALQFFLDIARLGTSLIQFDQEIGGGQSVPCYSRSHGHPPGFGNWMWTDFRNLCSELLKRGKSIRPDFGLSIEHSNELAIPYMATQWTRQGAEVGPVRGVGLFSYLYHECIPLLGDGYSLGQGMPNTWGSAELRCYRMANTLARGLIPTVYMEQVAPESKDEWVRTVSRAFAAYCRPYSRFPEYLLLGTTRRPPQIECPEQEVWYWQADEQGEKLPDGRRARKATICRPTVVAGSFEAEDGSLGTVIVNVTARPQRPTVRLTANGRSTTLFGADRKAERRWDACPSQIALSLEPFGVRMLVVR